MLTAEYHEYTNREHFGHDASPQTEFPELLDTLHLHLTSK